MVDSRTRVEELWRNGDPRLDSNGLPDISTFNWHQLGNEDCDSWVVAPADSEWRLRCELHTRPSDRGNIVIYGNRSFASGKHVMWGNDNLLIFCEDQPPPMNVDVYVDGADSLVSIGSGTTCNQMKLFVQGQGSSVIIGSDCMFAYGIIIRNSDDHSIFDINTGEHINPPDDVEVGQRVWLCPEVIITKGARIGDGSIIATRSLVTSEIEPFTLSGGVPAKTLRTNVSWDRPRNPSAEVKIWAKQHFRFRTSAP